MANPEHLAILKKGVGKWNRWREENPSIRPDLLGADLGDAELGMANINGANLSSVNFSAAKLVTANLSEADLGSANLRWADLCGADLRGAELSRADLLTTNLRAANLNASHLFGADLSGASLKKALLSLADLTGASLYGADLSGANLAWTNFNTAKLDRANLNGSTIAYTSFTSVDLSGVIDLETVIHEGPSSIGVETIYRSKGKIPHVFLRGCGVPENFIEYMASLVGTGIEFYSLFISYSSKDKEFAERLHADLQDKGVRCWKDDHDMRGGRKLHEQIDEAIRVHDKLLLILSPNSMTSEWVKTEIFKAREREVKEGKRVLFPIRLCSFEALRDWKLIDGDTGKDLAREIREYFIPDFSNWKDHDSYTKAFDRLLDDLHGKSDSSAT